MTALIQYFDLDMPTVNSISSSPSSKCYNTLHTWWTSTPTISYSQLPQTPQVESPDPAPTMEAEAGYPPKAARWRIYWFALVLCSGGALFGYDSGVIGGVLTFPSFTTSFSIPPSQKTQTSAIAVGIQQAGAFAGCFLIWPVTNHYGRRLAMTLCSLIFCLGVILETIDSHSLSVFYIGRVICGLGVGGSATVIPIYMSEMSPKEIRGRLGSCYQLTYTEVGARQWQVPVGLQLVPGVLMGAGMLGVKESVRWLLSEGREAEAWESMVWVRGGEGVEVKGEFEDMRRGLEEERDAKHGFRVWELQSTGSTALAYFGPQFFELLVGGGDRTLLLTGIFGAIKVVACLVFVVFLSDRFGRRPLLGGGAAFMAVCMIATAAVVKSYPQPGDGTVTSSGIVTVALIYLDIIAYNFSWGPLPWPCVSEIFPTRSREPGVAFGVGSQWLFNFIWSFSTPYIQQSLGWGTFLLFGLLDVVIVGFTYFFLKETAGKSLEEINGLFDVNPDAEHGWKDMNGDATSHVPGRYQDAQVDTIDATAVSKHRTAHVESIDGRS
ncbi:Major facilitator superfamily domain general substrate transporter [Penicillium expansum]|nr:Major facilitator superfamily domain general substrate transporter [Penicillium expansum]